MKRFFAGSSDTGLVRSVNQDAYYSDPEGRFFIVADGMGGHAGGQEASRIALETIKNYLLQAWNSEQSSASLLEMAFQNANEAILKDQKEHPERSDMGTTGVVLIFREQDHSPWCGHIGDSRLYRLRGAHLQQVTEDHTWVAQAMNKGILSPDAARVHPWRHVLSQCLGRVDMGDITVQPVDVQPGDRLLLCSDGLTEELSDTAILNNFRNIRAPGKAVMSLIDAAKEKGGRDNITVVVVAITGAEDQDATQAL